MSLTSPGLSVFFTVSIDAEFDLGAWNSISGLGMNIQTRARDDSAMTFFQHHLPSHIDYPHITLSRFVVSSSTDVLNWLSAYHLLPIPTVGEICCVDQSGSTIASWQMIGISPVKWVGPTLDAGAALSAPTEKLEIAHMGFL